METNSNSLESFAHPQRRDIESLIRDGYSFSPSAAISQAWDIFKKEPGLFIGYVLLLFVGRIVLQFLGVIHPIVNIVLSLGMALLTPALTVGFWEVASRIKNGQSFSFDVFFLPLKTKMLPLFASYLLMALVMLLCMSPFLGYLITLMIPALRDWQSSPPDFSSIMLWMIPVFLLAAYFGISFAFALPLVYFGEVNPWKALWVSRRIIQMNFLAFLGFFFLCFLVYLLGIMALFIGLLAAVPVVAIGIYTAYDQVVGAGGNPEETPMTGTNPVEEY